MMLVMMVMMVYLVCIPFLSSSLIPASPTFSLLNLARRSMMYDERSWALVGFGACRPMQGAGRPFEPGSDGGRLSPSFSYILSVVDLVMSASYTVVMLCRAWQGAG
jgi:hypothetical protein